LAGAAFLAGAFFTAAFLAGAFFAAFFAAICVLCCWFMLLVFPAGNLIPAEIFHVRPSMNSWRRKKWIDRESYRKNSQHEPTLPLDFF
jgi:cell division protein FtsW (lipid II flippase)